MEKEKLLTRFKKILEKNFTKEKWIQGYKDEIAEIMCIGYQTALDDSTNQDLQETISRD